MAKTVVAGARNCFALVLVEYKLPLRLTPEPPLPKTPPGGRGSKRARREPIDHFGPPSGKALTPDGRGTTKPRFFANSASHLG
jgi:hypothetical protein